jgi:TonB family protein
MAYQALLFCPEEKTARTVTQVLSELEFAVEPCSEPFAAVKKLMGGHFDAVVVDCENEQNATLLFKSARNSAANQGSLAVAVVEGQIGVAKAFRIGANLVLTKPINVEQAKGTLRVARGLLRKGEPTKPGVPAVSAALAKSTSAEGAPATSKTSSAAATTARPAGPGLAGSRSVTQPTQPATAVAAASAPALQGRGSMEAKAEASNAPESTPAPASLQNFPSPASMTSITSGSGAASAPAPARSAPDSPVKEPAQPVGGEQGKSESRNTTAEAPAPELTFGGANAPAESRGGSKKIMIGVAAALLVAAALYAGWTQLRGKSNLGTSRPNPASATPSPVAPASQHAAVSSPAPSAAVSSPSASTPAQPAESAASQPADQPSASSTDDDEPAPARDTASAPAASAKPSNSYGSSVAKSTAAAKPAAQPIVVKNGTGALPQTKPATPDTTAPALTGIPTAGSGGSLSNLIGSEGNAPKPVLQTVNVSQGVSQGLILKRVQPTYPPTALRMRVEGAVQLMATISKTGDITAVKVLSGEPLLTRAATDAVKQWKYKPYLLNGEPVEIQTQITVNFKLPR